MAAFWLDKCCISQVHSDLLQLSVQLLAEFVILSDGFDLLLSWSYFHRLWCVYEWAAILLLHDWTSVKLSTDGFVRSSSIGLLIDSIVNFKLERCCCAVESDREILHKKVTLYYRDVPAFEKLLKFTAIALIGKDLAANRASYGPASTAPWAQAAYSCGFGTLGEELEALGQHLVKWRHQAVAESRGVLAKHGSAASSDSIDIQAAIDRRVHGWFGEHVAPLIETVKKEALRETGLVLETIKLRKQQAAATIWDELEEI